MDKNKFVKGSIEKRGIVSNVRYMQKADVHTRREVLSSRDRDIETKISYNISFQIENMVFTYQTKYDHFINDGDEIIVNASSNKNGTYNINFYKNFTNHTDNFLVFPKEYLSDLSFYLVVLIGVLYFIFSGAILELFSAPFWATIVFLVALLASIYPFILIPSYIKLEKRMNYFKTLS